MHTHKTTAKKKQKQKNPYNPLCVWESRIHDWMSPQKPRRHRPVGSAFRRLKDRNESLRLTWIILQDSASKIKSKSGYDYAFLR